MSHLLEISIKTDSLEKLLNNIQQSNSELSKKVNELKKNNEKFDLIENSINDLLIKSEVGNRRINEVEESIYEKGKYINELSEKIMNNNQNEVIIFIKEELSLFKEVSLKNENLLNEVVNEINQIKKFNEKKFEEEVKRREDEENEIGLLKSEYKDMCEKINEDMRIIKEEILNEVKSYLNVNVNTNIEYNHSNKSNEKKIEHIEKIEDTHNINENIKNKEISKKETYSNNIISHIENNHKSSSKNSILKSELISNESFKEMLIDDDIHNDNNNKKNIESFNEIKIDLEKIKNEIFNEINKGIGNTNKQYENKLDKKMKENEKEIQVIKKNIEGLNDLIKENNEKKSNNQIENNKIRQLDISVNDKNEDFNLNKKTTENLIPHQLVNDKISFDNDGNSNNSQIISLINARIEGLYKKMNNIENQIKDYVNVSSFRIKNKTLSNYSHKPNSTIENQEYNNDKNDDENLNNLNQIDYLDEFIDIDNNHHKRNKDLDFNNNLVYKNQSETENMNQGYNDESQKIENRVKKLEDNIKETSLDLSNKMKIIEDVINKRNKNNNTNIKEDNNYILNNLNNDDLSTKMTILYNRLENFDEKNNEFIKDMTNMVLSYDDLNINLKYISNIINKKEIKDSEIQNTGRSSNSNNNTDNIFMVNVKKQMNLKDFLKKLLLTIKSISDFMIKISLKQESLLQITSQKLANDMKEDSKNISSSLKSEIKILMERFNIQLKNKADVSFIESFILNMESKFKNEIQKKLDKADIQKNQNEVKKKIEFIENRLTKAFVDTIIEIKSNEIPIYSKNFNRNVNMNMNMKCLVCSSDQEWKAQMKNEHYEKDKDKKEDNRIKYLKDIQIKANKLGFGSYSKFLEYCDSNTIMNEINNSYNSSLVSKKLLNNNTLPNLNISNSHMNIGKIKKENDQNKISLKKNNLIINNINNIHQTQTNERSVDLDDEKNKEYANSKSILSTK